MKRTTVARRAVLAGVALLTTAAVASACGGSTKDSTNAAQHPAAGTGSATPSGAASMQAEFNDIDAAFTQMMLPHHEQAVQMAMLAKTRAVDPQVKQFAAQVEAEAAPQIVTMAAWLKTKGVPTMPAGEHNMPGMSGMPGMASSQEMARLKAASGVTFDRMFVRMMIAHHNGAVQMCRDMRAQGINGAVSDLADSIEQSQGDEVATLQAILDRL
jgi:uncharacterized protein (DUF305 family)